MEEESRYRRHRHQPGIFGPLLLILIGVLFLLGNLGAVPWQGWELVFRFWPMFLIIGGLEDLVRNRKFVGPIFGICLGVVLQLNMLGMLSWSVWGVLLRFWPVLLIALGVELVIGRRSMIGSALAALLIIATAAGAVWWTGLDRNIGQPLESNQVSQALEDAREAGISISPATGILVLSPLEDSSALVEGSIAIDRGEDVRRDFQIEGGRAEFTLRSAGMGNLPSFGVWEESRRWELGVTPRIPVDLDVQLGAGEVDLDLRGMRLDDLTVNTAVGRTTVRLPAEGRFDAQIEGAIGEIRVVVPRGTAVRIEASNVLGERRIPAGYEREGDETYVSPDYERADDRIDLRIDLAIGQLVVEEAEE